MFRNANPGEGEPSIYQSILKMIDADTGSIPYGMDDLPDSEEVFKGEKLRFVAGAMDGIMGHAGDGVAENQAKKIYTSLFSHCGSPTDKSRSRLYALLQQTEALPVVDPLLRMILEKKEIHAPNLHREAVWLAENGAHRNVVKYGIALLGLFVHEDQKDLLLTLGKHEEFTLYVAVALGSNDALFELAKHLNGWGKVHIVERLEPVTQTIRDWLLADGCRNSVMNNYLAYPCAVKGQLHEALRADDVSEALYDGAGDIISALIEDGPAADMDDYEHSHVVIPQFLRLAQTKCTTVNRLSVLLDIEGYLSGDGEKWPARCEHGWNESLRGQCITDCQAIILSPDWGEKIGTTLAQGGYDHYCAVKAAERLGIDVWDELLGQLKQQPLDSGLYYELMKTDSRERVQQAIDIFLGKADLSQLATGPADEMGFGPGYEAHGCLDMILQSLSRFDGVGAPLVEAALWSPVIRNRHMALRALQAWSPPLFTPMIHERLAKLARMDPDRQLRAEAKKLLKGKLKG